MIRTPPPAAYAAGREGRQYMERSLAAIFAAAATVALATLLVPHWARVSDLTIALVAFQGYPLALILWRAKGRFPMWAFQAVMLLGSVLISVGVYFAGAGAGSATVAFEYLWIAVYTAHFFPARTAAGHIGFAAASYGVVLGLVHERSAIAEWTFVVSVVAGTGIIVGRLSAQVRSLALRDHLTGLGNRRAWEEALPRALARAERDRTPLCVAMLDVDGFKARNDRDGHLAGDRVLAEAASAWAREVRAADLLARYGGDEFALLLPDCTIDRAMEIVARLELVCEGVSFSTGLALWDGAEDIDSLVHRADQALYSAKSEGGGRSVLAAAKVASPPARLCPWR
ncbi:MAG: putative signaling protein [Acidimicrobiales bacterium]|nr:putative signaling protein [Acidimicrobiales bacterium]